MCNCLLDICWFLPNEALNEQRSSYAAKPLLFSEWDLHFTKGLTFRGVKVTQRCTHSEYGIIRIFANLTSSNLNRNTIHLSFAKIKYLFLCICVRLKSNKQFHRCLCRCDVVFNHWAKSVLKLVSSHRHSHNHDFAISVNIIVVVLIMTFLLLKLKSIAVTNIIINIRQPYV